jgi:hypothetical protein
MLIRRSVGRKLPVPVRALRTCYRAPDKLGRRSQYLEQCPRECLSGEYTWAISAMSYIAIAR